MFQVTRSYRTWGALGILLSAGLLSAVWAASDSRPVSLPFKDMNGKTARVNEFRGKPIVLNFWATWCVPCRSEMPLFVEAEKEYEPRGVAFIAVSLDARQTRPKIPDFIGQFQLKFPV